MKQEKKNRPVLIGVIILAIAAGLLVIDQVIKYYVLLYLKPIGRIPVIDNFLDLAYIENTGAAFGLFKGHMWLVVGVTVIASIAIIVLLFRYHNHTFFSYATSALLIAGGFGNLIDRFMHGFVVDYFHVLFFDYIFNFADCCITVGAVFFVIHILFFTKKEEKKQPEEAAEKP